MIDFLYDQYDQLRSSISEGRTETRIKPRRDLTDAIKVKEEEEEATEDIIGTSQIYKA